MKVAFLFPPWSVGNRPLNFYAENFWISSRGATGSEIGVVCTAREFVRLGHDVHLFTVHVQGTKPDSFEGIHIHHFEEAVMIDDTFNAVVSWSEPDVFRSFTDNPVRVVCEMLNDWTFCQPGFNNFVDIWTAPSERLKQHLISQLPESADKWSVVPLGVDPSWYTTQTRVPGSVVSISSPDRGLHLLLQQWPKIKQVVPEANLKVFYHLEDGILETYQPNDDRHPNVLELAQRVRFIKNALKRLEPLGVTYIGSTSRIEVADILSKSQVAVCPLSTVAFSEGFSVATLEALTAGCLPVVGDIDCLGSIYSGVAPVIPGPVEDHLYQLTETIIRGLTDEPWRQKVTEKCKAFGNRLTWQNSAKQLENLITSHPKFKQEIAVDDTLVKINVAAGPNVFPSDNWINIDREDMSAYVTYLLIVNTLKGMPQDQKKLAEYIKGGAVINYQVHDITTGLPQFADNSTDLLYFGQSIEHFNIIYQIPNILKELHRILKPGGLIRITTPDFDLLLKAYLEGKMNQFVNDQPAFYKDADPASQLAYLMFAATGPNSNFKNYEGHMFIFTKESMTRVLRAAGFREITFYTETGKSLHPVMACEAVDVGVNHSLIVEAIK